MSITLTPWAQWRWHERLFYRLTHWGRKPRFVTMAEWHDMMISSIYNVDPLRTPLFNVTRRKDKQS